MDNSQKTQNAGTIPTYAKAADTLVKHLGNHHCRWLDYGAGLGLGAEFVAADSFEPNPKPGYTPTYCRVGDVPNNAYSGVMCLNVLNVVRRHTRTGIVLCVAKTMCVGGYAVITTRGREVMKAKGWNGTEPHSRITTIGTYQKGFTARELVLYLQNTLGNQYRVTPLTHVGSAGALIHKLEQYNESKN